MSNKSDKMATWPITKLLYSMSLPAVFSMLIQALYNIVDTMYVAQYSQKALFSIGLVFPLQMISIALAIGGTVGCCTLVSRKLGEQNKEEASYTATTGVILTFFHIVITALVGFFFSKTFLSMFTSDLEVINMGFDYLSIVMVINFGVFFAVFFERLQQAQGNMIYPMISQLIGALINIILDPILIFGYYGFSPMGIKGAAIATVIAQICAMIFITCISIFKKHDVKIKFKGFSLKKDRILEIYNVGLPVMIMNSIGSLTTTLMNGILVNYSQAAVTALSIHFKLQSFVFMPIFGFNQGSLPILSYSYGAKNYSRYLGVVKTYLISVLVIMGLGVILFWLQTDFLLGIFDAPDSLLDIGRITLKYISLAFPIAAVDIVMTTIFQSLGKGFESMLMSILRQLGILVPASFIFGWLWGLDAIWLAYPFAEFVVFIIFLPRCIKAIKSRFNLI